MFNLRQHHLQSKFTQSASKYKVYTVYYMDVFSSIWIETHHTSLKEQQCYKKKRQCIGKEKEQNDPSHNPANFVDRKSVVALDPPFLFFCFLRVPNPKCGSQALKEVPSEAKMFRFGGDTEEAQACLQGSPLWTKRPVICSPFGCNTSKRWWNASGFEPIGAVVGEGKRLIGHICSLPAHSGLVLPSNARFSPCQLMCLRVRYPFPGSCCISYR